MKKNSFFTNSFLNILKFTILTLLPLLTTVKVVSVLGLEFFGQINLYTSIFAYISILVFFGVNTYSQKLFPKIKDNKIISSNYLSGLFSITFFLFFLILIIFVFILFIINIDSSVFIIIIYLAFSLYLNVISGDWFFIALEKFNFLLYKTVIISIFQFISITFFINSADDVINYLIYMFLSNLLPSLVLLFYLIYRYNLKISFNKFTFSLFLELFEFFKIEVFSSIYLHLDIIILSLYTNSQVLGLYSFVFKFYNLVKGIFNTLIVVAISKANMLIKNEINFKNFINNFLILIFSSFFFLSFSIGSTLPLLNNLNTFDFFINNYIYLFLFTLFFSLLASITNYMLLIPLSQTKVVSKNILFGSILNAFSLIFFVNIFGVIGALLALLLTEFFIFLTGYSFANSRNILFIESVTSKLLIQVFLFLTVLVLLNILIETSLITEFLFYLIYLTIFSFFFYILFFKRKIIFILLNM
jgi:O-antigen/teichoic acid export membrane protein